MLCCSAMKKESEIDVETKSENGNGRVGCLQEFLRKGKTIRKRERERKGVGK